MSAGSLFAAPGPPDPRLDRRRVMWNSVPLTLIVEFALFALGLAVYLRDTRARDRVGSWGLWAMVAILAAFFLGGTFGGAPPSVRSLAMSALGLWLFVPWAWWVDGHRDSLPLPSASGRDIHPSLSGPGQ